MRLCAVDSKKPLEFGTGRQAIHLMILFQGGLGVDRGWRQGGWDKAIEEVWK